MGTGSRTCWELANKYRGKSPYQRDITNTVWAEIPPPAGLGSFDPELPKFDPKLPKSDPKLPTFDPDLGNHISKTSKKRLL